MTISLFAPVIKELRANVPPPGVCDTPQVIFGELMEEIRHSMANQPRTLQKRLGPSEIGDPCNRAIIAKLMCLPEPAEGPNWRAWVGTSMHVGLEDIFSHSFMQQAAEGPRYLLETRVTVGVLGDWQLTGSCDLFDIATGCVVDWKTKSKTQMQHHRREGMGEKYRVQAQCYAHGMAAAGYTVNTTMLVFLLRDGDLSDAFYASEPYDPQVAIDALARANQLLALGQLLGAEAAMAIYPHCDQPYCRWCGNYRAPFGAPRAIHTTLLGLLTAAK